MQAQGEVRSYSNEFLSLGVGARGLAMGNAVSASTRDVTAGYWNPAGLSDVDSLQVAAMHAEWFAGIAKYDYAGFALPIADGDQAISLSVIRFAVDNIPNTLFILEPDGSINYDNISVFSAADYAALLSYARSFGNLRVGATAKVINRRVGTFATAWGVGLDLGAQYLLGRNFRASLTIKDFPRTLNTWAFNFTEEEKQQLAAAENIIPVNSVELTGQRIILGAAYKIVVANRIGLLAEVNADLTTDGQRNTLISGNGFGLDPKAGLELSYGTSLFLRAGVNNIQTFTDDIDGTEFTSIQPNVGVGLRIKEVQIDYAFTGLNRTSDGIFSHIVSLRLDFAGRK
ncbi:MAG: PorV/PorQ family protein [Chitinophagales bacterium]